MLWILAADGNARSLVDKDLAPQMVEVNKIMLAAISGVVVEVSHPIWIEWAKVSDANRSWLMRYWFALNCEHVHRFGEEHGSTNAFDEVRKLLRTCRDRYEFVIWPCTVKLIKKPTIEQVVGAYRDCYRQLIKSPVWTNRTNPFEETK